MQSFRQKPQITRLSGTTRRRKDDLCSKQTQTRQYPHGIVSILILPGERRILYMPLWRISMNVQVSVNVAGELFSACYLLLFLYRKMAN
jgi:hypothetical protein